MRKKLPDKVKWRQPPFTGLAAENFPSLKKYLQGAKHFCWEWLVSLLHAATSAATNRDSCVTSLQPEG